MAVAVQADMCLIVVMTDTALAQENARLKARLAETEAALADGNGGEKLVHGSGGMSPLRAA